MGGKEEGKGGEKGGEGRERRGEGKGGRGQGFGGIEPNSLLNFRGIDATDKNCHQTTS